MDPASGGDACRGSGDRRRVVIVDKSLTTSGEMIFAPQSGAVREGAMSQVSPRIRPSLSIVILAWAVRLVSLVNILNALLRYQPKFIYWLGKWVPFEITEGHRFRMFLMSVLLFVLASGLQRGKRLAWQITVAGLMLAPILHLDRGTVWPVAAINLVLISFLVFHRRYFVVDSDPRSIRSALIICPIIALALLIFGTIRLHALHKHTLGDHTWLACFQTACELVFIHHATQQIAVTPHSRDLFTNLRIGGTSTALIGLILVLRPVLLRRRARVDHREATRRLIALYGNDPFDSYTLMHDKSYFFSSDEQSVISYVLSGNLAVVLADPIGPVEARAAAITEFVLHCRQQDWEPVFYEIPEDSVELYEEAGLVAFKIGEEARVDAKGFHLKGREFQNVRTSCNYVRKRGIEFVWYEASRGVNEELERQLAETSNEWLEAKKAHEMTFDMGAFSIDTVRRHGIGMAVDAGGEVMAFATWRDFAQGAGRTLDLMRARPGHPHVMDFVLVESILHFQRKGINDISLGNAPLANAAATAGLQAEDKAVRFLFENLNKIYGYKSLFEFKRKYRPQWKGRYLAYHRGLHLPLVGLALVRVHSPGGVWRFLMP